MKNQRGNIFILALAAGIGASIWWQARANISLRTEHERLQAEATELARLRSLQVQQKASAPSEEELRKLKGNSDEIARLRSEIERLKKPPVRSEAKKGGSDMAKDRTNLWKNVGQACPTDTLRSVIWAATNGDIDAILPMLAFEKESRDAAEALYATLPDATRAQYPNAEILIATMICGRVPTDFVMADMIEQTNASERRAIARFQLKRAKKSGEQAREVSFCFQRSGNDWKLLVPASAIEGYRQSLQRR